MRRAPARKRLINGFTLIEMSIVLVIIGLLVGGILVGQDLINGATVRAQIAQIEKYNSAVHTFQNKYGELPGDLALSIANQFGFVTTSCTGTQAQRDGNGLIEGYTTPNTLLQGTNETSLFWQDLTASNLIADTLPLSTVVTNGGCGVIATSATLTPGPTYIGNFFPPAKVGYQNFLYVYSLNGVNWYGLAALTSFSTTGRLFANTSLPVNISYNIDNKIDDGLATSGSVVAVYINNSVANTSLAPNGSPDTTATCYNSSTNAYSTSVSNGTNLNCALSFKFQ